MIEETTIESLTEELKNLQLRVQQVEQELTIRREIVPTSPSFGTFTRGNRVKVVNKIKRPATWSKPWGFQESLNERNATVTHRVKNQVWFVTDNGTKTWRAPNNLRHTH